MIISLFNRSLDDCNQVFSQYQVIKKSLKFLSDRKENQGLLRQKVPDLMFLGRSGENLQKPHFRSNLKNQECTNF